MFFFWQIWESTVIMWHYYVLYSWLSDCVCILCLSWVTEAKNKVRLTSCTGKYQNDMQCHSINAWLIILWLELMWHLKHACHRDICFELLFFCVCISYHGIVKKFCVYKHHWIPVIVMKCDHICCYFDLQSSINTTSLSETRTRRWTITDFL